METPGVIRIVIAEPQPVMAAGMAALLGAEPGFLVAGVAANPAEAAQMAQFLRPEIVILDLSAEDSTAALAAIGELASLEGVRIIVYAGADASRFCYRAIKAGAAGYVSKRSPAAELIAAIRRVHAGKRALSAEGADHLAESFGATELTARETEVLGLIATGLLNKEIAARLSISRETVQVHVRNIFGKLRVTGRTEAAVVAVRRGLVAPAGR